MRLSSEDAYAGESCSIQNQRDLLYDFIRNHHEFDNNNVMEFCDDGYSGMNFQRPSVQKLLSLAGSEVRCIIVKDFSRFGRNLIEVGNYLDQVFPFLGVRFIAVNEDYDSSRCSGSTVGLDVSLKAMISELYSRDISEKIRCVQQAKMRKGEYLCAIAFYGYKRSQTEKNRLEIDEAAAEVVRQIFSMAAEGTSMSEIAAELNRNGVPSPLMYRKANHTDGMRGWNVAGERCYWTRENVKRIVSDERYTGCLISRKRTRADVSTSRTKPVPKSEWIVAKNTHKAIISREIFEQAQNRFRSISCKKPHGKPKQKFRGILKCAFCGRTLTRMVCKETYFYCPARKTMPDSLCGKIYINEQDLEKTMLASMQIAIRFWLQTGYAGEEEQRQGTDYFQKAIWECQAAISRYKTMQRNAFEDYAEGHICQQEYLSRKKEVAGWQEEAAKQYVRLSEQAAEAAAAQQETICLTGNLGRSAFVKELNRKILEEFVRAVKVRGNDRIEIVWNFRE